MPKLSKQDYQTIYDTIKTFNTVGKQFKATIEEKIDRLWAEAFLRYQELCQGNQSWATAYEFIKDYEAVTSFDMDNNFQISIGDSVDRIQVYSATLHDEYQDAYEHVDAYRQTINDKLSRLDSKRFAIGKKLRHKHLENELRTIENEANLYTGWQHQDDLKNEYLATKTDAYLKEKTKFNKIDAELATTALCGHLQNCAIMACRPEKTLLNSNITINGSTYQIDNRRLIHVANDIREQALTLEKNAGRTLVR